MAAWAVFTFGGSGPAITAHGSLDLKQEIQIQIQMAAFNINSQPSTDMALTVDADCPST
jgi:hypothetical protein